MFKNVLLSPAIGMEGCSLPNDSSNITICIYFYGLYSRRIIFYKKKPEKGQMEFPLLFWKPFNYLLKER